MATAFPAAGGVDGVDGVDVDGAGYALGVPLLCPVALSCHGASYSPIPSVTAPTWSDNHTLRDLGHAPYALYDVKYIDLVSLAPSWSSAGPVTHILTRPANPALTWVVRPMFCMMLNI